MKKSKKLTPKLLKKIRLANGLSQTKLAELLGYDTYHSISLMENGRREIPVAVENVVLQMKK